MPVKISVCAFGEPEDIPFIPRVIEMGIGVELQSYGLRGALSEEAWRDRIRKHREFLEIYKGPLVIHGPFLGLSYTFEDYLLKRAVNERMDMIYKVVEEFRPYRLVLHSGYNSDLKKFNCEEEWFRDNVKYWKEEVKRFHATGVEIVLENVVEQTPDVLLRLHDSIDHPGLKLCMDLGHVTVWSITPAAEWIGTLQNRITHFHLHDNDGKNDKHKPLNTGKADFYSIVEPIKRFTPDATLSLEVDAKPDIIFENVMLLKQIFWADQNVV